MFDLYFYQMNRHYHYRIIGTEVHRSSNRQIEYGVWLLVRSESLSPVRKLKGKSLRERAKKEDWGECEER